MNKNKEFDKYQYSTEIRSTYYEYVGMFGGILGFNGAVYFFTNPYNQKIYIGQTININTRMLNHKNDLNRGAHPNKELQKDYNDLKKIITDKDPLNDFQTKIYYHKGILFESSMDVVAQEITKLIEMEQIEIANAINNGLKVYNLSGLPGKASIVEGKFYSSLSLLSKFYKISIEQAMRNLNDSNITDWKYVYNPTCTIQAVTSRPVVFIDPIKKVRNVFNSLREAGIFMKDLYQLEVLPNPNLLQKYRSYGILFSRREITKICEQNDNSYLYYQMNEKEKTN